MDLKKEGVKVALVAGGAILGIALIKQVYDAWSQEDNTSLDDCIIPAHKLTYDKTIYKQLADQFQSAVWKYQDGWAEEDDAMADILMYMENDHDVHKLICEYGVRARQDFPYNWLYLPMNLPETVTRFLDMDLVQLVNDDYEAKGMATRFFGSN